jgi:ankyrin repeat domain-containing protein 50
MDLVDDIGGTALSYALCSGHNDLLKLLFKKGTKADLDDNTITTLFISAVKKDHEATAKSGKANPEVKDASGWTPLICAVEGGSCTAFTC